MTRTTLAVDVGADQLKLIVWRDGAVAHSDVAACQGRAELVLAEALRRVPAELGARVQPAVTGGGCLRLASLWGLEPFNEVVATAEAVLRTVPQARTVFELGAQGAKWIRLGEARRQQPRVLDFSTSGVCAAGSGRFLAQQADRLGVDVAQLGQMAASAKRGATIAGRCSVFAKSDMIHLQQKGTPAEEIAYGLCLALARSFLATVVGSRELVMPVVMAGGGGANPGLLRAFAELLHLEPDQLVAPEQPLLLGAIGAALMRQAQPLRQATRVAELLRALERTVQSASLHEFDRMAPLSAPEGSAHGAALDVQVGAVDVQVGTVDVQVGTVDVQVGTVDVQAGAVDVQAGAVDVQAGAVDVQAGAVDVQAGAVDVQAGAVDVQAGAVDVQAGAVDVQVGTVDVQAGAANDQGAGPVSASVTSGGVGSDLASGQGASVAGPVPASAAVDGDATDLAGQVYLGVDVGSVSTNLVLLTTEYRVLAGVYLPTRGRPVDVLQQGLAQLRGRDAGLEVVGVGVTGSGRRLAAALLGADVIKNEITAQAVSSAFYAPEADTIFEIGGQDAKFIRLEHGTATAAQPLAVGRVADFEMNKICAAGTGSFLEEQAGRLGVGVLDGDFARRALSADQPPNLGTRCTVFMDAEVVRAQQSGVGTDDLCAGLAYSVARNYLDKVVGGRKLGERILFQGGTASNEAVVAAFRAVLPDKQVRVHPHNRISGAIGVAFLAAQADTLGELDQTAFRGFDACADASTQSFECPRCENRCQVNRIRIDGNNTYFGDACEFYASRGAGADAAARDFPELFAARGQLFEQHLTAAMAKAEPNAEAIGLLGGTQNAEYQVLWATLLVELGYRPVLAPAVTAKLLREHDGAVPPESCLPIKAAAAQAKQLLASGVVARVFVPGVLEAQQRAEDREASCCIYTQQLGDMLRATLGEAVCTMKLALDDNPLGRREWRNVLARVLDRPAERVASAVRCAVQAQERFTACRRAVARGIWSAPFDRAVVVLGKPYNVHDSFLNLSLAKQLERLGLQAIPYDLLPLEEVTLDPRWSDIPWHFSREQLRALQWIERDPRLFPIWVSSFGCGPDGMTVKHIERMLSDRPRLLLEFDEHQGEAGLVTRLEAFADEIDTHISRGQPSPALQPTPGPGPVPKAGRLVFPNFAPHVPIYASLLRAAGYEVRVMSDPDAETLRLGEAIASGRECHPFSIVAGDMARFLNTAAPGEIFVAVGLEAPCLLRQYGDALRLEADRVGRKDVEVWTPSNAKLAKQLGPAAGLRLYEGFYSIDILLTLLYRLRPYVVHRDRLAALYDQGVAAVSAAIERGGKLAPEVAAASNAMYALPRRADPGTLPVVGVTGDLFTRLNSIGNANLYQRLEELGCEVWPSPAYASLGEISSAGVAPWMARTGRMRNAVTEGVAWALMLGRRRTLMQQLSQPVRQLCAEPPPQTLMRLARHYNTEDSSYLVKQIVGKVAHFLSDGADGVVSASGVGCMVGVAASAHLQQLRADYDQAPVEALIYGRGESPALRLRLETFVQQVKEQRSRRPSPGEAVA